MKSGSMAILLAAFAVVTFTATAQDKQANRFLSVLNVGQSVSVKDVAGRFEITIMDAVNVVQSHKIIEVGNEFIVVEDVAGVTTRIPIYSIKAIVKFKAVKK